MTAPTVSGSYASTSPWDWNTTFASMSTRRAYAAWALDLPSAASLVSAELVIYRTSGGGSPDLRVTVAPVTDPPASPDLLWESMQSIGTVTDSQTPRDVTARVAAVLDHPEWVPGHLFAVMVDKVFFTGSNFAASLTVTFIDPAQATGTLTYTLDASASGSTPARATGEATYTMSGTATGYRQPTEDRAATASLVYELDIAATSARPSRASGSLTYTLSIDAASIAALPPPPPPWRDAIHTAAYRDAIAARTVTIDARVDILDPSGAVIARLGGPDATHGGIVGGTVTVLEGRDIWWDCDLDIDQAELTPTEVGDLLHPLSHNRIRPWWRIETAPGRWVEVPVGTYYADWPSVAYDGGASVSMQVRGQDVSWLIARAQMQGSVSVGGATVDEAVRAVLTASASWAPLALTATDRRLPAGYEAGEPGANPWTEARALASSVGMELRVTREGIIELGERPSPTAPAVASFVEGEGCMAISAAASVPTGSIANRMRVDANPRRDPDDTEDIEPFSVTVTDDDPTSPLWIGHGYIYDASVSTDAVTTVAQARAMAEGLLRARQALTESGELVIFPAPHLEVGDVVDVSIPSVAMVGARQVRGWSLALGDLGGQRLTVSGRRQW